MYESRVTLTLDESISVRITLRDTYLGCNGHEFRTFNGGNLEQWDELVNLDHGTLYVEGDYILRCKSAAQELSGRKSRLAPSEVTQTYEGAKLITSFDDFTEYAKGFLDDDALQYAKEVLENDTNDTARLKKVAQLIEDGSAKIGRI